MTRADSELEKFSINLEIQVSQQKVIMFEKKYEHVYSGEEQQRVFQEIRIEDAPKEIEKIGQMRRVSIMRGPYAYP